jgi:hypothetical protein
MASLYDIVTVKGKEYYRLDKNIVSKEDVPQSVLDALTNENVVDDNNMVVVDEKSSEAQAATEDNLKDIKKLTKAADTPQVGGDENQEEETDDGDSEESTDEEDSDDDSELLLDDSDADEEEAAKKPNPKVAEKSARDSKPAAKVAHFRSTVPQSRPGMGFPRVNGKTVDIFDGQTPHTHLKNVGGLMVPLSAQNFRVKSDGQIMTQLKKMGMEPIDFNAIQHEKDMAGNAGNAGNGNDMLMDDDESDDATA